MAADVPLVLTPGRVFHGRYEVVRTIETGGMGAVYEVIDERTRRRRALKVMLPSLVDDRDMRARFELEARITGDVETDHIVETFDAGVDEETGAPFLLMELLRGEDLGATLEKHGRMTPAEVALLLEQAARALDRTHDAGIVHRDLKPGNLFVTRRDDGTPHLKVLDFGIAKLVAQSTASIRTTRSVGTPLYMSPEQVRGEGTIDHRADLYSLGHIAFALIVGVAYWEPDARASQVVYPLLMKIAHGAKDAASVRARARDVTLPPGFDAWFAKATALEPHDRFESAGELARALSDAIVAPAQSVDASATTSLTHVRASTNDATTRGRPGAIRTIAIVAVAALVALFGLRWSLGSSDAATTHATVESTAPKDLTPETTKTADPIASSSPPAIAATASPSIAASTTVAAEIQRTPRAATIDAPARSRSVAAPSSARASASSAVRPAAPLASAPIDPSDER